MNGATTQVNILFHGLFFMRLNPLNNNLEVLAPVVPEHHYVGGPRGSRQEITDKLIDRTDLTGKQGDPPSPDDIPGSVFQFLRAETNVKLFTGDLSKFKGMIVLPWPKAFYSLRSDDIAKSFPYVPTSKVGISIELNARRKRSMQLGAVTLLQYTMSGAGSLQNIHYYNQPCKSHNVDEVNADLQYVMPCFSPDTAFDLQLRRDAVIVPVDVSGNSALGTTPEDEMTLFEDPSPDARAICPRALNTEIQAAIPPASGVSPANCPTIFAG